MNLADFVPVHNLDHNHPLQHDCIPHIGMLVVAGTELAAAAAAAADRKAAGAAQDPFDSMHSVEALDVHHTPDGVGQAQACLGPPRSPGPASEWRRAAAWELAAWARVLVLLPCPGLPGT